MLQAKRGLQLGYGQASLTWLTIVKNASTFPSLFNPQHHPMKHENELGKFLPPFWTSFLDLIVSTLLVFVFCSLISLPQSSLHCCFSLLGSQVKFCCSPEFHSSPVLFSLFGYSNGIEGEVEW